MFKKLTDEELLAVNGGFIGKAIASILLFLYLVSRPTYVQ